MGLNLKLKGGLMDSKKAYSPPRRVEQEVTITRWSNGEVTFDFEGLSKWSEVHALCRLCEKEVRHRLSTGKVLSNEGEKDAIKK